MLQKIETPEEGEHVLLVDKFGGMRIVQFCNGKYVVSWFNNRPQCLGIGLLPPDATVWRWVGPMETEQLNQMQASDYGTAPQVFGDIPAYWSPLSFKTVAGRKARREEMARYNVIEIGSELPKLPETH